MKPTCFDLSVRDLGDEYWRITAGAGDEPMPDLAATRVRVTQAGGSIVEPHMPIPGIGWYATCAEPGGLRFGLIEADAQAR